MAKLQGVWATGKTLEECHREFERSHRGLDCIKAEIWSSNTRHQRALKMMDFSFSAMIFLAFRPIRPTASEPERLPGKQDKSEMNSSPLCQDRTISNMHRFLPQPTVTSPLTDRFIPELPKHPNSCSPLTTGSFRNGMHLELRN